MGDQDVGVNWESSSLLQLDEAEHFWLEQPEKEGLFRAAYSLSFWGGCSYRFSLISYTGTSSSNGQTGPATTSKYYDDVYFDSDSDDEDQLGKWLRRGERGTSPQQHSLSDPVESSWGGQGAVPDGGPIPAYIVSV